MTAPLRSGMSGEEYLGWEAEQEGKHEYLAGNIFSMPGASDRHVTIVGNLFTVIRDHLRGTSRRVYASQMKLRVEAVDAWFYPDVMVTCDPADHQRDMDKTAPVLIIEVLSPSTEAFDRGKKFAAYRTIPSLSEYVLIDPDSGRLELYRRNTENQWVLHSLEGDAPLELASIQLTLDRSTLFEDVQPQRN